MPVRKQDPPSCLNLPAGGEAALLSDGDVMGLCLKWARRVGRKRHWVFVLPSLTQYFCAFNTPKTRSWGKFHAGHRRCGVDAVSSMHCAFPGILLAYGDTLGMVVVWSAAHHKWGGSCRG